MARHALLNSMLSPLPSTARRRSILNCVTTVPKRASILCDANQRGSTESRFLSGAVFSRKKFFDNVQRLYGGEISAPTSVTLPRLSCLQIPSNHTATTTPTHNTH